MTDRMLLHLYAQGAWHDDAYIAGTRDALTALRDAIDRALAGHHRQGVDAFTGDGEGYTTTVVLASVEEMERFAMPYTDAMALDPNNDGPWNAAAAMRDEE